MKAVLLSILVGAVVALAAPAPQIMCDIACVSPSAHDPNAVSTDCNCKERFCPPHDGPGGPNIPVGETWAFNATSGSCGPVIDPQAECQSLDIECIPNYTYGWVASATACECAPDIIEKRLRCDIVCVTPTAHDPHADPISCNCDERVCPVDGISECPLTHLLAGIKRRMSVDV